MWSKDQTLSLAFNGEAYNFVALREELEKRGHHFNSSTDPAKTAPKIMGSYDLGDLARHVYGASWTHQA